MFTKGNIVRFERGDQTGIVLAVKGDGSRANVYRYGPDFANWVPTAWLTVEVSGDETCYKCGGSGLYYFGGMVLNGVYQGKTGPCFGCEGSGTQTDADRLRCHHYWHHKGADSTETPLDRSPEPKAVSPAAPVAKPAATAVAAKPVKPTASTAAQRRAKRAPANDDAVLIDCKGCGTLHRDDTMCPW